MQLPELAVSSKNTQGALMDALELLFSYEGRIGRRAFIAGSVAATGILAAGVYGSFLMLGPAATIFSPMGINAGAIQTAFLVFMGVLFLWMLLALFTKRLRDGGRPIILAPVAILPPVAVLIANGLLTIRPLLLIPAFTQNIVYFVCGGIGLVMIADALLLPSRKEDDRPRGYLEGPGSQR